MEKLKANMNKIIIIIVLVFLGTFIYNYVNKEEYVDILETSIGGDNKISQDILETVNALKEIDINYKFFTETLSDSENILSFKDLIDFSIKELPEKAYGKSNPFLKSSRVYTTTSTATTNEESIDPITNIGEPSLSQ